MSWLCLSLPASLPSLPPSLSSLPACLPHWLSGNSRMSPLGHSLTPDHYIYLTHFSIFDQFLFFSFFYMNCLVCLYQLTGNWDSLLFIQQQNQKFQPIRSSYSFHVRFQGRRLLSHWRPFTSMRGGRHNLTPRSFENLRALDTARDFLWKKLFLGHQKNWISCCIQSPMQAHWEGGEMCVCSDQG